MKKVLTVIGARPQIIKAAALSRAFHDLFNGRVKEYLLHTGQHYDDNLSQVFFEEMNIPKPDYQLEIGSSSHGAQTGRMMEQIESV
ncbi:MAG: UDP-N-acetylglucosamine 2-epimerase, partial [Bacteroidota bacterium]